ncbi:hypothetical protein M431DRAFT_95903 [Trichoderma harzianum CBS 226.95]|uniref:Uncharacterized protein n=1 Tax=Trichoderma harzianum CBS 226.95 TaxID=983964 RepID=A0A2T3ZZF1_TRIHA|nr:hypothetical protein M431DRAFT_95903 [Trichoderma harzianum CBS 226.95]PTB50194.1 hypothetical protein M431DRAFT_95903 [Trichoderma harzianum CBS 226.95]
MVSGNRNTSTSEATLLSRSGTLARTETTAFQNDITRRLQLKSVLFQQKLDWYTVKMAIKTSIPPAVLVCAIQSDSWTNHFKTNAYLAPIISACVLPALPRAMLIRHNIRLTFAIVLAYCWALLAGWCGVQARQHTTNNVDELNAYNSSAEAVVAIFLIFFIWSSCTLKSAFPDWGLQCTIAGILAVATMPGIARAPNTKQVIDQTNIILEAFLVGQAVGLANALILFPQSCRDVFKKDMGACLDGLAGVTRTQRKCMQAILLRTITGTGEMDSNPCASQLEAAVQHFVNEVSKTRQNSEYAAREISWGVFDHSQLEDISSLLVDLIPPASGLSSVADMLQLSAAAGYNLSNDVCEINRHSETDNDSSYDDDWQHLETAMHQHSQKMTEAILEGIEHAKVRLELIKGRSLFSRSRVRKVDVEHRAVTVNPGEAGFLESYRDVFEKGRVLGQEDEAISNKKLLECYIQHRPQVGNLSEYTSEMHSNTLRYFLFLHSQTLLSSLGNELLNLLTFLDDCYSRPKRLLIPPVLHPSYWVERFVNLGGIRLESTSQDAEKQTNVELGPAFYSPKNPDHLPPSNLMETIGDYIRKIPSVFRSDHAAFGLRVACAIMTIAIIAFLHDSQNFYFRHRFLWSLFAILLSMARTAGSSTFLLLGRVLGTLASMITSYIIWYVVDQKTPGILVFLWLWFIVLGYLFVKFPSLFSIWFVALIASIVMIANELQVRKLGEAAVLASGQAVYAPYIIFPYRLAFVTLGVVTGYFWTIFPYPLSEHSELRENMAKTMYGLAGYYMCIQQTVLAHLHGNFGDIKDKRSPGFHLQAARRRIFHKYQALSTSTKTGYQFLDWEFGLGGRFPKQTYGEMISILERLGSYMTLISYVSRELKASKATSSWWANDPTGTAQAHLIPKGVTTRMIILHSALSRAHPLPPKLTELEIPHMGEFLTRDVPADAGFAAAALIHSVTWYLIRDVNRLTQ